MSERPSLRLGRIVGTKRVLAMSEEQRATHMQIIGASGTGKSSFMESLIRQDAVAGQGLCLIDPHGELAGKILAWASRLPIPLRNFYYIAPHQDDWTVCYNIFRKPKGVTDAWFLINAMKLAAVKVWGADNTLDTPRIDEWLNNCFFTAVELGLTLPEVALLLEPTVERNALRQSIAGRLSPDASRIKSAWLDLCYLAEKKPVELENRIGSTIRRLSKFLDNPRLRRIFGVADLSLDLRDCMDEGAILLVDLSPKGKFHPEDAQLFGTLLLTDFYVQMFNRQNARRPFTLYIDEFQNFATRDLARMLDEARKFGLRLVLAHQRPGQLRSSDKEGDRDLYSAVMTNARTKIVFGGIDPEELEPIAKNISMGSLDTERIKREIRTRSVLDYVKEYWEAHSQSVSRIHTSTAGQTSGHGHSSSHGLGGSNSVTSDPNASPLSAGAALFTSESRSWQQQFGDSEFSTDSSSESDSEGETEGTTTFPVLVPQLGEQLSAIYYETLDEQLYQFMAILNDQQQRHAMARVVGQKEPLPIVTPFVRPAVATPHQIERQLNLTYTPQTCFLPVAEADRRVEDRRKKFLCLGQPDQEEPETFSAKKPGDDIINIQDNMKNDQPATGGSLRYGGVEIQPRDFELLADLFDTRFISIRHAAALYFDGKEPAAKQRLLKLHKAGLVDKQEINFTGPRGVKSLYVFKKQTLDLLLQHGYLMRYSREDWDSKLRKRFVDIAPATIEHELGLLDIRAALQPALAPLPHVRVIRFGTWPLEYEFYVPRGAESVKQQPDGYLCFAEHSPRNKEPIYRHFYLEYDRGTETLDTIVQKVEGYRHHYRSGGFCVCMGRSGDDPRNHPFRVLFIVPSAARQQNILARLTAIGARTRVWITTLEELLADPLGPIWIFPQAYKEADKNETVRRWGLLDDPSKDAGHSP